MKYPLFLSREEIYNGHYSIKKRDATCEFTRDLHYHDFYEIQFYLSDINSERDRTNTALPLGEITVSEETLPLVHGSLVLINMFEPHQIQITCEQPYIRYCISFDSSLLLFACSDTSNLFNIFSSCARSGHVRRLTSGQILDLISICRRYETLSIANGRDTGFHSYAHFYRTFKKITGMSPTEYQKRE